MATLGVQKAESSSDPRERDVSDERSPLSASRSMRAVSEISRDSVGLSRICSVQHIQSNQ
eukprot:COSAG01_NODE_3423_length_6115_cov_3.557347_2_plen_60_part_00